MLGGFFKYPQCCSYLVQELFNPVTLLRLVRVNHNSCWSSYFLAKELQRIRELSLRFHSINFNKALVTHKELHHGEATLADHLFAVECVSIEKRVNPPVPQHSVIGSKPSSQGRIRVLLIQLRCYVQCPLGVVFIDAPHFTQLSGSYAFWSVCMSSCSFKQGIRDILIEVV